MFYICAKRENNTFGIMDTNDGIVEYYTPQEIYKIIRNLKIDIDGVTIKDNKIKLTIVHIEDLGDIDSPSHDYNAILTSGNADTIEYHCTHDLDFLVVFLSNIFPSLIVQKKEVSYILGNGAISLRKSKNDSSVGFVTSDGSYTAIINQLDVNKLVSFIASNIQASNNPVKVTNSSQQGVSYNNVIWQKAVDLSNIQKYAVDKLGIVNGKKFKWTIDDGITANPNINICFKSGNSVGYNPSTDSEHEFLKLLSSSNDKVEFIDCLLIDFDAGGDCYIFIRWEASSDKYLFYEGKGRYSKPFSVEYKEAIDMFNLTDMKYDVKFTYEEVLKYIDSLCNNSQQEFSQPKENKTVSLEKFTEDEQKLFIEKCKSRFSIMDADINDVWAVSTIPFCELGQNIVSKLHILECKEKEITYRELLTDTNECGLHIYWSTVPKLSFDYGIYLYGGGDFDKIIELKNLFTKVNYLKLKSFGLNQIEAVLNSMILTPYLMHRIDKPKKLCFKSNASLESARKYAKENRFNVTQLTEHLFMLESDIQIVVISDYKIILGNTNLGAGVFAETCFTDIDLRNVDTSPVTDMSYMFDCCKAKSINISEFNTSKVIDMECMFANCTIEVLDLSNFDTSNVKDMRAMFEHSKSTRLDLSNFNTSKVIDMECMFYDCDVQILDISSFDISKVTNMRNIFVGCTANIKVSDLKLLKELQGLSQQKANHLKEYCINGMKLLDRFAKALNLNMKYSISLESSDGMLSDSIDGIKALDWVDIVNHDNLYLHDLYLYLHFSSRDEIGFCIYPTEYCWDNSDIFMIVTYTSTESLEHNPVWKKYVDKELKADETFSIVSKN